MQAALVPDVETSFEGSLGVTVFEEGKAGLG